MINNKQRFHFQSYELCSDFQIEVFKQNVQFTSWQYWNRATSHNSFDSEAPEFLAREELPLPPPKNWSIQL